MNRRSFLKAAPVAPIALTGLSVDSANAGNEVDERFCGSIHPGEPGYENSVEVRSLNIGLEFYVDGEAKTHTVAFDTKNGWLRRLKTNRKGYPMVGYENELLEEVLHGKVQVFVLPVDRVKMPWHEFFSA